MKIPVKLKLCFIVHFVVDLLFAIPLFFIPEIFLSYLGWKAVDPIAARMTAAALFGIGIESFLSRNAGFESYRSMLSLKIIWSSAAILGLAAGLVTGAFGIPAVGGLLLGVFVLFNILWIYWFKQLVGAKRIQSDNLE